jgi:endoglucanase
MSLSSNLQQLSELRGVSGDERAVRQWIEDAVRDHVDEMRVDTMGNLLAVKHGRGKGRRMRVMVDAHMDEIGLMVVGYNGNGGLKVRNVGSLDPRVLPGKVVWVGADRLPGVIGVSPVHLARDTGSAQPIDSLSVDIGASGKEHAEGLAKLGTSITFSTRYRRWGGGKASGKAFDDRAGCAVLIELLRGARLPVDLLAAFTVQEEVGLRGAQVAAFALKPDAAFALDATPANDLPSEEDRSPNTRLGAGPAVYVMLGGGVSDPRMVQHVLNVAEKKNLRYQIRQPGGGGTDANAITRSRSGVPSVSISVPCRYIHSPVSVLSLADVRQTVELVGESVGQMTKDVLKR